MKTTIEMCCVQKIFLLKSFIKIMRFFGISSVLCNTKAEIIHSHI
jgi:hypothetical protein